MATRSALRAPRFRRLIGTAMVGGGGRSSGAESGTTELDAGGRGHGPPAAVDLACGWHVVRVVPHRRTGIDG
jgi:hypothetical protein